MSTRIACCVSIILPLRRRKRRCRDYSAKRLGFPSQAESNRGSGEHRRHVRPLRFDNTSPPTPLHVVERGAKRSAACEVKYPNEAYLRENPHSSNRRQGSKAKG